MVKQSTNRIKKLGRESSARIIHGDLLKQDYRSAALATVYLLSFGNEKLQPVLEQQLRKGARVVPQNAPISRLDSSHS